MNKTLMAMRKKPNLPGGGLRGRITMLALYLLSALELSMSRAVVVTARVSRGSITSSTRHPLQGVKGMHQPLSVGGG